MVENRVTVHKTSRAGIVRTAAALYDFSFPAHSHDHACVGLVRGGALDCRYGSRRYVLEEGDLMLVNPGEVHDGRPCGSVGRRYTMLAIPPPVLQALGAETLGRAPGEFRRSVLRDPRARAALAGWCERLGRDDVLAERDAAALLLGILAQPADPGPRPVVASDLAHRAMGRLRARGPDADGLGELAAELGASRFQLVRAFRRSFGLTPEDVRRQLRVERARSLLHGRGALAAIALASGFADQSHMTREFRRVLGFSPGAYRRGLR